MTVLTVDQLVEGIDVARLQLLGRIHNDQCGGGKFCDVARFGGDAIGRVRGLGLFNGPALSILDVGCAFGYFVRACRLLRHNAEGLDLAAPMYEEACAILQVPVHRHHITARRPLPDHVRGYDLINMTGFGLPRRDGGDRAPPDILWGDWIFFVDDLLDRLRPNGRLEIVINFGRPWQEIRQKWQAAFGGRTTITQLNNQFTLRAK